MIFFAASGKGGTGRSVTCANLAYHRALDGDDVCYVDFDFGSPTTAAVFDLPGDWHGTEKNGLHSYLRGACGAPERVDVWKHTEHPALRLRPVGAGRLVLLPGDLGGGEFPADGDVLRRCADLVVGLDAEFDIVLVDLSAGRSFAVEMALAVTSLPGTRGVRARWLVHHRWTRQQVTAAADLVHGERGIVAGGVALGHDEDELRGAVRFVRTAVPEPDSGLWLQLTATQAAWLRECDRSLRDLAAELGAGYARVLGSVPLEPLLQWREQLVTDSDVLESQTAAPATWQAFGDLAARLTDPKVWGRP